MLLDQTMLSRSNLAGPVAARIQLLFQVAPNLFFFPSGLARRMRAKREGKKEVGLGGILPRAAASEAWPWAIILPPLAGLRSPERERATRRRWWWLCEPSASSEAGFRVVFITSARSGLLEQNC